jgi:hypothetical protein
MKMPEVSKARQLGSLLQPNKTTVMRILHYDSRRWHMLAVGRLFSRDWEWVKVRVVERTEDKVVIEFKRIETNGNNRN